MRLHNTAVEKILSLYSTFGGHSNDQKLREALNKLDLTVYEQNKEEAATANNPGLITKVLVPTAAMVESLTAANKR